MVETIVIYFLGILTAYLVFNIFSFLISNVEIYVKIIIIIENDISYRYRKGIIECELTIRSNISIGKTTTMQIIKYVKICKFIAPLNVVI